jgi:hypothetical protein
MAGGDFPKSSGIAGQAAEPHPGAADHDGRSVGAAHHFGPEVVRWARRSWPRLGGYSGEPGGPQWRKSSAILLRRQVAGPGRFVPILSDLAGNR